MYAKKLLATVGILVVIALLLIVAGSSKRSFLSRMISSTVTGHVTILCPTEFKSFAGVLVRQFQVRCPRATVELVAEPQTALRRDIIAGKRNGILLTIGPKELTPLDQQGCLRPGSRIILADVPLVIIADAKCRTGACNLDALERQQIHTIALAPQSSSLGEGAVTALQAAKIWETVKSKVKEYRPGELAALVASGKADVAIAGAYQVSDAVRVSHVIDARQYPPIQFLAVETNGMQANPASNAFLAFLKTDEARAPLLKTGLVPPAEDHKPADSLFLYCGAGLRKPAQDLIAAFRQKTGIPVVATYTGSGCLLAQITVGEEGDLYMPGEEFYMQQALKRSYVLESRNVTYFIPVIMVAKGNPKGITSLNDLYKPGVRVGLGERSSVAIGQFTPIVLKANGLSYEKLQPNVVATFGTAPELGTAVKLGAIDAALQWDSVAAWYLDSVDVIAFPTDDKTISKVPLGILKFTKHPREAKMFLDFVSSKEGKAIFARNGHSVDPAHPRFPAAPKGSR